MESYNRSLIRYVSSKCHKFPRNFVSKILVLANRPIVISGYIAFMEEKELTPEEAEFIQKIKSKINVVRSMERLYAVPSEQLRVWLVWLSKVGDMADEWHKWLRSHIDFVLRLSIELRAAEEVLTLEQEKEEETAKKEIQVETKVETKEIETNTKEDSKEETKENEKVEEKNNTESGNTNNTGPGNSNNSGPGNANNSGPGNSNNPGPENSNNSGPGNSNNPGLENSNNPGPENSNNPGPENSNNPGPENSNNPGPGNPNDEENDDEKTEEKRDETETPTEESDKPNEELITEEEKNPEEGEKEEEERREEEEEGEAETVVTEIVEKEEGAGEEEEEVKPSIVITEEEEEDEGQIIKEWPVGIPWEHLGIEEEEEKLFDDRLPIPKNEVEMKDFLRKFTHEATIHRSFFKHWKETADQAVKEIGNRLVMATFLVQGKDQTGEVKKPPPKKILKKVKPPVQKKGKKKKVASPARKTNDELEDDSKLEMTNKRELEIRKMLEIDANDFVKDCARGLEPLPYFFYLKVEPDIDIAIEHDDEKVILADTERENITGDYQRLYFNLSDKPCKGGKPWML
ncbi:cilia- and flagella-associated protein 251-like isoform X1 [Apis cerana]|uniref:cilia- and flagella-associated protein 251-like isoform X1 n=2 Tax=Apis cerana TaxID=7461 RepID=UPI002B23C32F|nr:cilia- and flagella-associated protein 251-like isoform X1 [Apis cerana]XP_061939702.1 cilia- and flagella-associated protein 251-like isoform X1 [Apis cerana]